VVIRLLTSLPLRLTTKLSFTTKLGNLLDFLNVYPLVFWVLFSFLFLIFCVGSKVGNNIRLFFTMFMKKNLIKVFYIECYNSILNLSNLFYKKYLFFISIKNIKNIKFKNIFRTREDNLSSCKIPKY